MDAPAADREIFFFFLQVWQAKELIQNAEGKSCSFTSEVPPRSRPPNALQGRSGHCTRVRAHALRGGGGQRLHAASDGDASRWGSILPAQGSRRGHHISPSVPRAPVPESGSASVSVATHFSHILRYIPSLWSVALAALGTRHVGSRWVAITRSGPPGRGGTVVTGPPALQGVPRVSRSTSHRAQHGFGAAQRRQQTSSTLQASRLPSWANSHFVCQHPPSCRMVFFCLIPAGAL